MTKQTDSHGNNTDLNRGRDGKAGHQAGHGGPDHRPDDQKDGEAVHRNHRMNRGEGGGAGKN
jgi:hypothetical protein